MLFSVRDIIAMSFQFVGAVVSVVVDCCRYVDFGSKHNLNNVRCRCADARFVWIWNTFAYIPVIMVKCVCLCCMAVIINSNVKL